MGQAAERLRRAISSTGDHMTGKPQTAQQFNQQFTGSAELAAKQATSFSLPKSGTKARIISVSTLYVTVELLEPTNLQPGQTVSISHG